MATELKSEKIRFIRRSITWEIHALDDQGRWNKRLSYIDVEPTTKQGYSGHCLVVVHVYDAALDGKAIGAEFVRLRLEEYEKQKKLWYDTQPPAYHMYWTDSPPNLTVEVWGND